MQWKMLLEKALLNRTILSTQCTLISSCKLLNSRIQDKVQNRVIESLTCVGMQSVLQEVQMTFHLQYRTLSNMKRLHYRSQVSLRNAEHGHVVVYDWSSRVITRVDCAELTSAFILSPSAVAKVISQSSIQLYQQRSCATTSSAYRS